MDFLAEYFNFENNTIISGLTNELNIFYVLELFKKKRQNVIVLVSSLYEANKYYQNFKTYTDEVFLFPMDDFLTSVAIAASPELRMIRLETLNSLEPPKIIITNLMGYLKYLPSLALKKTFSLTLKNGESFYRDDFVKRLEEFGYKRESLVTTTGEFSVRGYVIDIFPFQEEHPVRIEFFGLDIDKIKYFDEKTQRSLKEIKKIIILPFTEIKTASNSSLLDYVTNSIVVYFDKSQILASYYKLQTEIQEYNENEKLGNKKYMFDLEEINPEYEIEINMVDSLGKKKIIKYDAENINNFSGNFSLLVNFVRKEQEKQKKIIFCLTELKVKKKIKELFENNVRIINQKINQGFIFQNYVIIGENDLFPLQNREIKYKNSFRLGTKIKEYDQLKKDDYVVHSMHGIGIYAGLITLKQNNLKKDYLQINYFGNDKIYIPVENINNIYKYSGADGNKPKINKLNSSTWIRTKHSITKRIKDISEELIALYAKRNLLDSGIYKNYEEELLFANEFGYEETRDQTKAIEEVNLDLQNRRPMDRLLCGDVGFGKTEVAFRAVFKTVLNNRQVFYLCPTTILSRQQYESALVRFKNYPIEIALLNRFTSANETKKIITGLLKGTIDIVFGTHRLLSNDVKFSKLGLLIVDEEQRFGVEHKEKIKQYKNNVNVLTLSATPIPRTLKMALSGLRDLTLIDTPPINRYPIQTYVIPENKLIIKDVIYKELSRNGQIFVLLNNISLLDKKIGELKNLVPEAKIVCAHGKMSKTELESIMDRFINKEFDILLCTTIIETGIDIPNANTLIVYNSDHFGLSQLYQLRGRVGRSDRIAYAYLLFEEKKILNETALKRLEAIKEFTELGSGYKIAMRDLAIRGSGDILGSEQAGFVDAIGISFYLKLIEDEMKRQRGELVEEDDEKKSLVKVETHISEKYVAEENLKIEIHQKINEVNSLEKLNEVKNELEDRFGKVDESLIIYMYEEWFEKLAKQLNIEKVNQNERMIELYLNEKLSNKLKADKLFLEAYSLTPKFQFKYFHKQIIVSLPIKQVEQHFLYYLVPLLEKIKNTL